MYISQRWLQDFVKTDDISPRQFAADMTMSGSKVEGWLVEGSNISNVVVGRVICVEKHPGADSLVICQVDIGSGKTVQIVTGATNVVSNAIVPVALDGATVEGGKKIATSSLRGQESQGMLCSLEELGLTKNDFPYADDKGIFLLEEENISLGQNILEAIGLCDTVYEFEITSNRPDCLSVIGIAREASATYEREMRRNIPEVKPLAGSNIHENLSVEVLNQTLCPRYCAAVVKNVRIAPSPRWLRERLRACGVRPINNIVDITNYVMLEYGHPLHAFDYVHVKGGKIIVRNASAQEKITTLDGSERILSTEMLVIADAENPSAIAGVMGGEFSGVYETTKMVVFESACFEGTSIRGTSRKLGLRTESSGRFEKGLDPQNCLPALKRACELVQLLSAGDVAEGMINVCADKPSPLKLPLEDAWINAHLGTDIPAQEMIKILKRLEFTIENGIINVPSFRADVEGRADISEEVARIYGYNNIPTDMMRGVSKAKLTEKQKFERLVVQTLSSQGLSEIVTYSFISPKSYDMIGLAPESPLRNHVAIQNPLSEENSVMRTTAIPSMLEVLSRNHNNRVPSARMYELSTVYHPVAREKLPNESVRVMLGAYGKGLDFYSIKGIAETLLDRCGITDWEVFAEKNNPSFHSGRCARLTICGLEAGIIGEIHPIVAEKYGIGAEIYIADLSLDALYNALRSERDYKRLPRFPASSRDLALVCDESLPVAEIGKIIKKSIETLESLELFDVYKGKQVGEGKKSVAYAVTMRAADRTLTDEECDAAISNALKNLEAIGAKLRQ